MAAEERLDFHGLAIERVQLQRREPELAGRLERARHRAGAFPNDFAVHQARKLKRERQRLLDRLAELDGLLLLVPIRPAAEPARATGSASR